MPDEVVELNKKIAVLEQKLQLYEKEPSKRGYFALVRIVNQQIDILNSFNLKNEIGNNPKEDKQYDRVKAIWEGLKSMLIDLKALKLELRITPEEEEGERKIANQRTTPESIADVLGDNKQQHA